MPGDFSRQKAAPVAFSAKATTCSMASLERQCDRSSSQLAADSTFSAV